jgi:hypothetical protein
MRSWLIVMALAGTAWGRGSELIAFSRDGSQALMESSDRDREEGGSRTTYLVIGGGPTVEAMLSDRISRGSGARQHQGAAECRSEVEKLRKALRGFDVKLNAAACNKDLRDDLVSLGRHAKDGAQAVGAGQPLAKPGVSFYADGQKLVLTRENTAAKVLLVQLKGAVAAAMSPSGRLLLVFTADPAEEETSLAAIFESKSGKLEDLVPQTQK